MIFIHGVSSKLLSQYSMQILDQYSMQFNKSYVKPRLHPVINMIAIIC